MTNFAEPPTVTAVCTGPTHNTSNYMPATPEVPATHKMVVRSLRRRCPVCAASSISRHMAAVKQICPGCELDLERQVGSFIGGIGLNTMVSFVALFSTIIGGFVITKGEASITRILIPALIVAFGVPLFFYARSRLLWVAIELRFWPLEPNEVTHAVQ